MDATPSHFTPITEGQKFIYCLEAVADIDQEEITPVTKTLEHIALTQNVTSIYKTCDTIEGLEDSLNALIYDDHYFKEYEIIYLVMPGRANTIMLNDYYYSIEEIAEIFEGKMTGKIIHFSNKKALDLTDEESQYFLDVTGARAISGYGNQNDNSSSTHSLDGIFFKLFQENDDYKEVVENMFQKHYKLCKLLDFRLYY